MQNHKSAAKAHKQSIKRRVRNKSKLSEIATYLKKCAIYIKEKNIKKIDETFNKTQSLISKAINKKILKANNGSRKISRLHLQIKKLNSQEYKND